MNTTNINEDKHEIDKIEEYQAKGYTGSYQMINGKFTDLETKKTYSAKEITIVNDFRYEGKSNPNDMSILYILEMNDGTKGTVLLPYGATAETEMPLFIKEVEDLSNQAK